MKLQPQAVVVVERRRRGRPPIGEAEAHFRLPGDDYDAAYQMALAEGLDINDVFRRAIKAHVHARKRRNSETINC